MRILLVFLLLLFMFPPSLRATFSLTGTVRDSVTGEPLADANVRILGTSRGTITNTAGEYSISLAAGDYRILFTMLGYAADTVSIRLGGDMRQDARMRPSEIVLAEVVVSSEDPAIGIIRKAIANKQRWIDRLKTYEMRAFTRRTVYRDTAVAAISESYTKGFWQKGDTLREIVTQRRQTANIPGESNFASVGRILNFLDDRLAFLGFTFVGPTAVDALDYYDYRLLRTRTAAGNDVYEIRMIPRTRTVPLFDGTIHIESGSYALVGVDVHPNAAFRIPFTKNVIIRYRQQFGLYESSYWMPADIRINGEASISFPGVSFPRIKMTQTSVISDYSINTPIPDSIFRRPRLVVDSTATRMDTAFWAANLVLPLDSLEARAYRTLDSTQSLEVQFKPGGAAVTLSAGGSGPFWTTLSFLDLGYNRVEGFHLGAIADLDKVTESLSLTAGLAYGISNKHGTYRLGGTYYPAAHRTFGFGAEAYRIVDNTPERGTQSSLLNMISALFFKEDIRDYFSAEGWKGFAKFRPSDRVRFKVTYTSQREGSLPQRTNYSILFPSHLFRVNPPADPGKLAEVRLDLGLGEEPDPIGFVQKNTFDLSIERAAPALMGGNFNFTRLDGVLALTIPTFGQSYLMKPGFRIQASAGDAFGSLPVQRLFSIESAVDGWASFGVMRGADLKEFTGTGYTSVAVEHNFRNIPLLALGIPFLYDLDIDLIAFGGAARTWSRNALPDVARTGTYTEAGFSIGRILGFLRADFAWRLSPGPHGLYLTIGGATFF